MVKMLKSKKHVFWEALLVTILIFGLGLLFGSAFESLRIDKLNEYYSQSEVSLMDIIALDRLTDLDYSNCNILINSNLEFADKIYEEAKLLEKYDSSGRLSNSLWGVHKKYDLLRTFLWINSIKVSNKCKKDFHSLVYLYEYRSPDLAKQATQSVWSKILSDLKQEEGRNIVLIPIAVDSNLTSLNSLLKPLNITKYPVVVIDNKIIVSDLNSVDNLKKYLK